MSDVNLDALLDATLDDLEDLPEFKPFTPGAHQCLATLEAKVVADHPSIELTLKLTETLEQGDPSATPSKPGDEANVLFMMDNTVGQGKWKKVAEVLHAALGTTTNRELVEQVQSMEVVIVSGIRVDKKSGREYMDLKEFQVV
jgi:hypothetical protein